MRDFRRPIKIFTLPPRGGLDTSFLAKLPQFLTGHVSVNVSLTESKEIAKQTMRFVRAEQFRMFGG